MLRLALAFCLITSSAFAEDSSPSAMPETRDMVAAYRQLLSEANDRIAALSAQVQANARAASEWRAKAEKPENKKVN